MSDHDLNSDLDENIDYIKIIKEEFDLEDFLNSEILGPVLYEDAIKRYEQKVEAKVAKFYKNEVDYFTGLGAILFDNEFDYNHMDDLFKIIFSNIKINYNPDIIFENDYLVENFINEQLKKNKVK